MTANLSLVPPAPEMVIARLEAECKSLRKQAKHWQENCEAARAKVGDLSARLTVSQADAGAKDEAIAELVGALKHILGGALSLPRFAEEEARTLIAKHGRA